MLPLPSARRAPICLPQLGSFKARLPYSELGSGDPNKVNDIHDAKSGTHTPSSGKRTLVHVHSGLLSMHCGKAPAYPQSNSRVRCGGASPACAEAPAHTQGQETPHAPATWQAASWQCKPWRHPPAKTPPLRISPLGLMGIKGPRKVFGRGGYTLV
jgi:hypothetical protein